jgi:hypothetical protein
MHSPLASRGDRVHRGDTEIARRDILAITALSLTTGLPRLAQASPHGQLTWAVHISLAPTWFDPAEHRGSSRRT